MVLGEDAGWEGAFGRSGEEKKFVTFVEFVEILLGPIPERRATEGRS